MAAKLRYEVIAIMGKYINAQGEEKNRWTKLGVVLQSDKGFSLKLESIPVGWDGWATLSEPKPKEAAKPATKPAAKTEGHFDDLDDDIPF